MSAILYKDFPSPEVNRREILRYLGCRESTPVTEKLLDSCLAEILPQLSYKVCFARFPIKFVKDGELDLGFSHCNSHDLAKCLSGCEEIFLIAATIGLGIDRAIFKYGRLSPANAVCMQAIGAERIEALCDALCAELTLSVQREEKKLRPRFSPGYGDLSLALQQDIFRALECEKRIGLTLNESLLMSPTKSVTAIIGIQS